MATPSDTTPAAGPLVTLARKAQRRRFIRALLVSSGLGLSIGTGLGAVAVVADRLVGPGMPWWMLMAPAAGRGLAAAAAWSWRTRGSLLDSLRELDERLMLADRLGSGYALAQAPAASPEASVAGACAQVAVSAARGYATRVRAREAIRYRLGRSWLVWPVLAAAGVSVGTFVEPLQLLKSTEEQIAEAERRTLIDAATNQLDQAIRALDRPTNDAEGDAQDIANNDTSDLLRDLQAQMQSGRITDPDEVVEKAQDIIEQELDQLEGEAEEGLAKEQALQNTLGGLQTRPDTAGANSQAGGGGPPAAREDFQQALQDGDCPTK